MRLAKRSFASLGLVAALCIPGIAFADPVGDAEDTLDDTLVQTDGDGETNDTGDSAEAERQPDSEQSPESAPNGAPTCDTLRLAESISVVGKRADYVTSGTEGFTFDSAIIEENNIDEDEVLRAFDNEGFASYEDFADFFAPFNDSTLNLSDIHGIQSVTVTHMQGATCTGDDWHGSAALRASRYSFDVTFPTTSNTSRYAMPLYFDGAELPGVAVFLSDGADPVFDRLVALNGTEIIADEFVKVLESDLGVSADAVNTFPKAGEVYGKHTVSFADANYTYSVVTVVYPERPSATNPTTTPQAPAVPQASAAPQPVVRPVAGNPASSNDTVVTPSSMSYIQFRGNSAPAITPVGASPVASTSPVVSTPAPMSTPSPSSSASAGAKSESKSEASAPKLPVTFDDASDSSVVAEDSSNTSKMALIVLAACVVFGFVAAVSVNTIRRARRK